MSSSTEPAAFVLATLSDAPDPALPEPLRAAVADIADRWVAETAPLSGAVDSAPELPAALAGHAGPVLLVASDVPRLDAALAWAALDDLADGCVLSFAPATDGRPFLLALRDASPELLAFADTSGRHRDEVFAAASTLDGDIGLLRSERRVVTPADARALAIDPLIPESLRALAAAA